MSIKVQGSRVRVGNQRGCERQLTPLFSHSCSLGGGSKYMYIWDDLFPPCRGKESFSSLRSEAAGQRLSVKLRNHLIISKM